MKCYNCNATEATPLLMCPSQNQCGTPFKAQCMKWNRNEPTAFYADKIFSAHHAEGSSIFYPLNTADDRDNFTSSYELTPCSTNCCPGTTLSEDAVFEIQKSYVQLDCFSVNDTAAAGAASAVITPDQVIVNGLEVGGVTVSNGTYTADLANIITQLTNPTCLAQGLPSKAYVLLQNIGDLEMRLRFGFEGVVRSCGVIYRFKIYLADNDTILLPATALASFSIAEANIPCIENGMVPQVRFRFGATADIINPMLSVFVADPTDPCDGIAIDLSATLGIVPFTDVEVIRNTLMMINAAELQDNAKCGLDGFNLYAGRECCGAQPQTASASGVVRCTCRGNN